MVSSDFKSFINRSNCLLNEGCTLVSNSISKLDKCALYPNSTISLLFNNSLMVFAETKSSLVTVFTTRESSSSSELFMRYPSSTNPIKPSSSSSCCSIFPLITSQSFNQTTVFSGRNSSKETFSPVSN